MTVYRLTWDDYQGPRTLTGSASDVLGYAETSYLVDFGHMDDGSLDAARPDLTWRLGWNADKRNRFWLYADDKRTDVHVDEVTPEAHTICFCGHGSEYHNRATGICVRMIAEGMCQCMKFEAVAR